MDHAAAEAALVAELEVYANAIRQRPVAAAHEDGVDEQVELVDEALPDRYAGELRAADADVALGIRLQLSDRLGVELPLESRLRGRDLVEASREDDLLRGSPDVRVVAGRVGL